jgi:hypothetical protein
MGILSKKGWALISAAPLFDAKRCSGSFTRSPLMRSRAAKLTWPVADSGNLSGCHTTFNKVARLPEPLKGVFPNNSSYKNIPNVHQSTALPCPSPVSVWAGSEANNLLGGIETLRHQDIAEPPDNFKLSSSQKYLLFQTRRETQLHCNMPLYAKPVSFQEMTTKSRCKVWSWFIYLL